jgi:hypothetical protein
MLTENDVVQAVAAYLSKNGYRIESALSTDERGIDIVAINLKTERRLLVEAKGGTSSKDHTARFGSPFNSGQALSHVSRAFYTVAALRQKHAASHDEVALAFPDDSNHRSLVENIGTALQVLGITVFFVSDERVVTKY